MVLTGPDASRYQGSINWGSVRDAGHSFAILKATEGTAYSYIGWFHGNAPKVRAAGLTLGAYHFLRTVNPAAQARYFVDTVAAFTGVLAVLDVETASNGTKPNITHVREFVDEFRRLVPNHPLVIYTGRWYWVGVMGNPYGADLGPLWHSEYESSPDSGPDLDNYGGWGKCRIWQWTSSGSCPGISGRVDLNVFYGTHDDLAVLTGAKSGGGPVIKRPLTEDDMPYLIASTHKGVHYVDGSGATWISDPATVRELTNQGLAVVRLDANLNDATRIVDDRRAGTDEEALEQDKLQTLYLAAIEQQP